MIDNDFAQLTALWEQRGRGNGMAQKPSKAQLEARTEALTAVKVDLEQRVDELKARIRRLEAENARLRRMLYDMASLTDWMRAGYPESEYQALVREFEGEG